MNGLEFAGILASSLLVIYTIGELCFGEDGKTEQDVSQTSR
jgi:hypothetical protein